MRECYLIFARKTYFPFFEGEGGGAKCLLPRLQLVWTLFPARAEVGSIG